MNQNTAKLIILAGLAIVAIGVVFYLFGDKLKWIGNLPGDIKIEKENTRVYFPITTMIILSIAGSVLLSLIRRFLQ